MILLCATLILPILMGLQQESPMPCHRTIGVGPPLEETQTTRSDSSRDCVRLSISLTLTLALMEVWTKVSVNMKIRKSIEIKKTSVYT